MISPYVFGAVIIYCTTLNFYCFSLSQFFIISFTKMVYLFVLQKPLEPKSHVPPGYGGYIPALVPNNLYGSSYGELSKKCLNSATLT